MNGCLSIDFRPSSGALPRMLRLIMEGGFALRGIRLIPTYGEERWTLRLDLAGCDFEDVEALAGRFLTLDGAIEVIHRARPLGNQSHLTHT